VAGLRDEIELDISRALRQIDVLGARLTQQTQQYGVNLAKSIDKLRTPQLGAVSTGGIARDLDVGATAAGKLASNVAKVAPAAAAGAKEVAGLSARTVAARAGFADLFADIANLRTRAAAVEAGGAAAAGGLTQVGATAAKSSAGLAAFANIGLIAAVVGIEVFTNRLAANKRKLEEQRAEIAKGAKEYLNLKVSVDATTASLVLARIADHRQLDDLRQLGITIRDITSAYTGNADALARIRSAIEDNGGAFANRGLLQSLSDGYKRTQQEAKLALDQLVAVGDVSEEQARKAEAAFTTDAKGPFGLTVAVVDYTAALESVRPAAEDAAKATAKVDTALEALDKRLGSVSEGLDLVFGRFVDGEDATAAFESAVHRLGEELGKGTGVGEAQIDVQNRLADAARNAAVSAKVNALELARQGKIGADNASVQGAIRKELELLIGVFPELREQLQRYIDLLNDVPTVIDTEVRIHFPTISIADLSGLSMEQQLNDIFGAGIAVSGEDLARQGADAIVAGLNGRLGDIAKAGRDAGAAAGQAGGSAAAKEFKSALLKSGSFGLDLGGFILEGITLDENQRLTQEFQNFVMGLTPGLEGVVADAIKIDPAEQTKILDAMTKVIQASRDLATARSELGADSIEARVEELKLADAQREVNDVVLDATSAAKAYDAALNKIHASMDAVTGSLRGLNDAREKQNAINDAQRALKDEQLGLVAIDAQIGHTQSLLDTATSAAEKRRLTEQLFDLQRQRGTQSGKVDDAAVNVTNTQLDLIDQQQKLVELGQKVNETGPLWENYFRTLGGSAGLAQADVDRLVTSLRTAGELASGISNNVLNQGPAVGASGGLLGQATGVVSTVTNNYYITETTSARGTAIAVVNEQRATELLAGV
jgi:hypothetical protein